MRRIMEAGAKGCLIVIAGKLTGQRHRRVKFKLGHIKYCGEPRNQWMRRGFAVAKLKPGVIGVTVEVMDPMARLPDEVAIRPRVPVEGAVGAVPVAPQAVELAEVEPELPEPVAKGKVAARKLKKAAQKLREIGVDAEVPTTEPEAETLPEPPEDES